MEPSNEFLRVLDAMVRSDGLPPGFKGRIAVGVRGATATTWSCAHFDRVVTTSFEHEFPEGSSASERREQLSVRPNYLADVVNDQLTRLGWPQDTLVRLGRMTERDGQAVLNMLLHNGTTGELRWLPLRIPVIP